MLLKASEPIAASMPLMVPKNSAVDVAHDANVVIAQALLHIARMRVPDDQRGGTP
ncbi:MULTISPECIES: hypothetical protein [Paraburkholderia]|uniref:hypothetical protein n=1 Tax=Paraburkholderia TaxID=1822464 RepID=UPI002253EFC0|nr:MULTISPECIES: hypothetical protein [Paraburkholderia]MCX4156151.1 hypothetical protein [Paraburkholderia aspalathi]MDN7165557.1 hypothetical protein [Paraburkholderia sp. SECH2]MDQ6394043.1 hypothetical protein [Paraburkholderia aspalathi]